MITRRLYRNVVTAEYLINKTPYRLGHSCVVVIETRAGSKGTTYGHRAGTDPNRFCEGLATRTGELIEETAASCVQSKKPKRSVKIGIDATEVFCSARYCGGGEEAAELRWSVQARRIGPIRRYEKREAKGLERSSCCPCDYRTMHADLEP